MYRVLNGDKVRLIHTFQYLCTLKHRNMPAAKFEIKRICELCGTPFLAKTITSRYCSHACSNIAYKRRVAEDNKRQHLDAVISQIPGERDYISVSEAAAMFGVSKDTIRRLIRDSEIPSINLGKRLTRISKSALLNRLPLRETPVNKDVALPKSYNLEPENCYTIGEIIKNYNISEKAVYCIIRKHGIPMRQLGKMVYVPKSEIDTLVKKGTLV